MENQTNRIPTEGVLARVSFGLDLTEPNRTVDGVCILTEDALQVYADGEEILSERLSEISEFQTENGVGCAFASFQRKNGETVLFARGNQTAQPNLQNFSRSANRILRGASDAKSNLISEKKDNVKRGANAILRLLRMAKPEWMFIFYTVLLFFVTSGIGLLSPYLNRILVDDYVNNRETEVFLAGFVGMILSILAVNILNRFIGILRGYFLTVAGTRLIVRLRDTVFAKIQQLSISKILKQTAGELMKLVGSDTAQVKNFLINQLPNLLEQGILLIVISIYLFVYDWKLALLILLPAPFVAFAFRCFHRFMRRMFNRRRELNARENSILHDIFSGIRVVKSYGMERREEQRFIDMAAEERDAELRQEKLWAILMPLLNFLIGTGEYVLLFYVGRKMLDGSMTAGEMTQFSSYASMIYGPMRLLMRLPRQFMRMMTSLNRVFDLLDDPLEMADNEIPSLPSWQGEIDLSHVSFGYEGADEVLHDVNLHIKPGEFIGLVGKSGVGKSTLINLIMRMYDVEDGSISIDGVDIRNIPQETLRSHIGVVLQENFLFSGTVWQNLTYAKPDATRDEVIQAAKMAGAHEFIVRLSDGYNTYIGERGYTLSGGERQRISIARALLHDPRILILDEATASLDTETEKLIQDALAKLCQGRTTIAIAHRLSTLRNATRLVVMDHGRIAETGTHDELMEKQGIYFNLVMAQRDLSRMNPNEKEIAQ